MKTPILALTLLVIAAIAQAQAATPAAETPATPAVAVHANGEHPAVLVARQARAGAIDTNRFIVAPPASTRWTVGPSIEGSPLQNAQASAR